MIKSLKNKEKNSPECLNKLNKSMPLPAKKMMKKYNH